MLAADLIGRIYAAGRRTAAGASRSWDLALPIVDNAHVQRELRSFTTVERDQFLEGYRRSASTAHDPRPAREGGAACQLSWLPLVESWFK